jgi:hypothetical protein
MDNSMMKFICGCAVGIFLATAGTSGIAMLIDSSVSKFQNTIKESVREQQPRQNNQNLKHMESL